METNAYIFFVAALVPLAIGAVWYNPKVLGTAWMKASGVTEEQVQSGKMWLIFGLTYVMGLLISFVLYGGVVHQTALQSILFTEPGFNDAGSPVNTYFAEFMDQYGQKHRSFGHGALHGGFFGLLFVMPVIVVLSLFERKSFKYMAIHGGYWIVTLTIMGGLICAYA